jgi:hypothetical protein
MLDNQVTIDATALLNSEGCFQTRVSVSVRRRVGNVTAEAYQSRTGRLTSTARLLRLKTSTQMDN